MKFPKLIVLLFLSTLSFNVNAQGKVKLNCKKIELVYYETEGKIKVSDYALVNESGYVTVHLNGNRGLKFYGYQLSDKLINEINSLFAKSSLKTNLIQTKLKPGTHYSGSYYYITCDKESLCFIEPFMSKDFNSIFAQIENTILKQSEKAEIENPRFNIKEIKKRVIIEHKKSNYLPKIEKPHSMR